MASLCQCQDGITLCSFQSDKSSFGKIKIDGANGIGALKVTRMLQDCDLVDYVTVTNDGSHGVLNHKVSCFQLHGKFLLFKRPMLQTAN